MVSKIDPVYKPYFLASNKLLTEGVVQEALDRERSADARPVTLDAYVITRRSSIGLRPFIDLARWTWGLDLPDEVLSHPVIAQMEEATIDLVALANVC